MKAIIFFFTILGTPNWYHRIDKPTLYQRIYKWRIGIKMAFKLTGILYYDKN